MGLGQGEGLPGGGPLGARLGGYCSWRHLQGLLLGDGAAGAGLLAAAAAGGDVILKLGR